MSRRDAVRKVLADAALWGDVDAELLDSLTEAALGLVEKRPGPGGRVKFRLTLAGRIEARKILGEWQ